MKEDIARFSQGLQDLIFKRDKLNAELEAELARTEKLATAVASLRSLNDTSQDVIESTLYRIGAWREAPPPIPRDDGDAAGIAPRFAPRLQSEKFTDQIFDELHDMSRGVN